MAEDNQPKTDYSSNSAKSKQKNIPGNTPPATERPEIKVVASTTLQKKTLGRKLKETFTGDDAGSVGQYLFFDVIVPKTKELLYDMLTQGGERFLFGSSRPISRSRNFQGRTNYSGFSSSPAEPPRTMSNVGRANHRFDEHVFATREAADDALEQLSVLTEMYDLATVADFYKSIGVTGEHTDLKFGWTSVIEAYVKPVRGGYVLILPPVEAL